MTREEAIKWLDGIEKKYIHGGDESFDDNRKKAIRMAIRSFEAWDNLVKEMEEEMYYYDTMPDVWYGMSISFDIIKKYLKEAEEQKRK